MSLLYFLGYYVYGKREIKGKGKGRGNHLYEGIQGKGRVAHVCLESQSLSGLHGIQSGHSQRCMLYRR